MDAQDMAMLDSKRVFFDRRQKDSPVDNNRRSVERRAVPYKPDVESHVSWLRLQHFISNRAKSGEFVLKTKDLLPACAVLVEGGVEKTFTFL